MSEFKIKKEMIKKDRVLVLNSEPNVNVRLKRLQ